MKISFNTNDPIIIGSAIIEGVTVSESGDDLKKLVQEAESRAKERWNIDTLKDEKIFRNYRDLWKKHGIDYNKYRSSGDALIRRILNSKHLYSINNVVDSMNIISLGTGYSIGAYDLDKIDGDIVIRNARSETFAPIGTKEAVHLKNDLVVADSKKILDHGISTSSSGHSKVTSSTKNLLINIYTVSVDKESIGKALEKTVELIRQSAGGKTREKSIFENSVEVMKEKEARLKDDKIDIGLTVKKSEDFSEWYTQVIQKAKLADYTSVSGCMVLRPDSYAIWEKIQSYVDKKIKALGHRNVYFPMFIPEKLLTKEASHVAGFTPEVAWVTHAGEGKLAERLAVRPTSETIMYESYSGWIRSHRDLPLLLNQWCSVVRWEFKHPKPFLRTREFLWQEGHTAHATKEDGDREVMTILELYRDLIENILAIPVITGRKTESEKFAGALYTTTLEALMPDKKALQMGTSHSLGQNFAKAFDIKYTDENEEVRYVWQASWSITTRLIGALIMVHGDDKGLVLPPKIAPVQVVIVPIIFDKTKKETLAKSEEIKTILEKAGYSVILDSRDEYKAGFKYNEWELKGIPVRIEIGPRDIEKCQAVLVRRDTSEKITVKEEDIIPEMKRLLDAMQKDMYERAKSFLDANIRSAKDMDEFEKNVDHGFVLAGWCGSEKCEEKIKEETGATARVIPFDDSGYEEKQPKTKGHCVYCKKPATKEVYFAKAY